MRDSLLIILSLLTTGITFYSRLTYILTTRKQGMDELDKLLMMDIPTRTAAKLELSPNSSQTGARSFPLSQFADTDWVDGE